MSVVVMREDTSSESGLSLFHQFPLHFGSVSPASEDGKNVVVRAHVPQFLTAALMHCSFAPLEEVRVLMSSALTSVPVVVIAHIRTVRAPLQLISPKTLLMNAKFSSRSPSMSETECMDRTSHVYLVFSDKVFEFRPLKVSEQYVLTRFMFPLVGDTTLLTSVVSRAQSV